ncbi:MAG: SMP-30/gluconolactonase/LRE family protein [Clostridiales bacterium]|nr:SMP-30/gluconolactonase/LRE family protein [Clostridiales bacterium]
MKHYQAERLFEMTMKLGEGPLWDVQEQALYWVDIPEGRVWRHDPGEGSHSTVALGRSVGMCALAREGGLVVALEDSIELVHQGERTVLAGGVEPDKPGNRFNDGKCDPAGRLLVGTMGTDGTPGAGSLYSLTKGGPLRHLLGSVTVSNGIGFSPDNKHLYYVDTPSGHLWRFEYDLDSGDISGRVALIDYTQEQGNFDGLCVDSEGMIWVAHWDGYQVSRWDPGTGKKIGQVEVPAPLVTSCCFGGRDLDTLYITTARGWDEEQIARYPLSGALFALRPGVSGMEMARFG